MLSRRTAIFLMAGLAVSLLVNFALVGFMAARSSPYRTRPALAERLLALGPHFLPPAIADAVNARLPPNAPELREALAAVREARGAVVDAMRASPYDRAKVAAALAELHQRIETLTGLGDRAMLDALDGASDADRAMIGRRRAD